MDHHSEIGGITANLYPVKAAGKSMPASESTPEVRVRLK